jgi:alcohol dehydrogenase
VRALRFDGHAARLLADCPEPKPAAGEALIRPLRVALGEEDARAATPGSGFVGTLGREFVGTVVEVNLPKDAGPALAARARLKGVRVVADAEVICGTCDMCRAGLRAHCRKRATIGFGPGGRDGGLAELVALPVTCLVPVPETLDTEQAVFALPVGRAAQIARLFRAEGKPFITVLGDNAGALLTAQVLSRLNASVRLLGTDPARFGLCEKFGVKHRAQSEVGRRQDQDVVVDCTGSAGSVSLAAGLLRPRGKLILAGWPAGVSSADLAPIIEHEIEVIGSRASAADDGLALLSRGEVQVLPLISRRVRLAEAAAALAASNAAGAVRTLVEMKDG